MMKLPSLQQLYSGLLNVIKRFPLQFAFSLTATICWCVYIYLSDARSEKNEYIQDYLIKGILISNLGLALLLAIDLFAEANRYPAGKKWIFRSAGLLFCVFLFFVLSPSDRSADAYRIALFALAFHLLIAFAPFVGKQTMGGFWAFNKILFLRFLTSALYSAVLFAGLAIALVAINGLFSAKIGWQTYMMVFAVISAGFNTVFFLAGLPVDLHLLEQDNNYPKGLKIFTQFVLIPLMSIYLAILLVYELKIVVLWELPKGLVSSLILGYAVFGILSLLLVHPIKETQGNNWIKLFSRFFYFMMIPLIVLLILAIWKRVSHYGITESRYMLSLLALWLAGITLYFLLSKKENIKVIPISLCLLALLAIYGPQSAFSISKYAQLARLKKIIHTKNKDDQEERASVIRYLVNNHGLETLQPFTGKNLKNIEAKIESQNTYRYTQREAKIDTALALLKVKINNDYNYGLSLTFVNAENQVLKVKGYDYAIELNSYPQPKTFQIAGASVVTDSDHQGGNLNVKVNNTIVMEVDLYTLFKNAVAQYKNGELKMTKSKQEYYYPANKMRFSKVFGGYEYTVVVISLQNTYYGNAEDDKARGWSSSASYLLIRKL